MADEEDKGSDRTSSRRESQDQPDELARGDIGSGADPGVHSSKELIRENARQRRKNSREMLEKLEADRDALLSSIQRMCEVLQSARYDAAAVTRLRGGEAFVQRIAEANTAMTTLLASAQQALADNAPDARLTELSRSIQAAASVLSETRIQAAQSGHVLLALSCDHLPVYHQSVCWMGDVSMAYQLQFFLSLGEVHQQANEALVAPLQAMHQRVHTFETALLDEMAALLQHEVCNATVQNLAARVSQWMLLPEGREAAADAPADPAVQWQQPLGAVELNPASASNAELVTTSLTRMVQRAEEQRTASIGALQELLPARMLAQYYTSRLQLLAGLEIAHLRAQQQPLNVALGSLDFGPSSSRRKR